MQELEIGKRVGVIIACAIVFFGFSFVAHAESLDEYKKLINEKTEEIRKTEEESRKYKAELKTTQVEGQTLKDAITHIEKTIGTLNRDITINERQIEKTGLEIDSLSLEIKETESAMEKMRRGLAILLQIFFEQGQETLFATMIKHTFLSDFFRQVEYISLIQKKIIENSNLLRETRERFILKMKETESKKNVLEDLTGLLGARKSAHASQKKEQASLLEATQNKEKEYQRILEEQEKKRALLASEIEEIEGQIKIVIDLSTLPPKGSGVIGYPLPDMSLFSCWKGGGEFKNCLTQFFGYTSFAAAGGYGGKQGHNGADFRADMGTPVLAAERGIVEAVGDTDKGCRGASYGKWVLIRHPNNLSTLYAHLSAISVAAGQKVVRGERIGLSGKSGYATGPHLHFGVFAAQAVEIKTIVSRVCGRNMTLPVAGSDPVSGVGGYLNPLDYL